MTLIKCSECGNEISDKAAACIHCGCPISASRPTSIGTNNEKSLFDEMFGADSPYRFNKVLQVKFPAVLSGAENESSLQSVYVKELGRNVEFTVTNTIKVGQLVNVPLQNEEYKSIWFCVTSVSKAQEAKQAAPTGTKNDQEIIALIKNYKPNGFMQFLASRRFYALMTIYFGGIGYLLMEDGLYMASVGAAGMAPFFLPLLIAKFLYPLHHLKKFLKQNNLEDAIKNDTGQMNVAISVYNQLPNKKTLAYIKTLNAEAAQSIEQQLAARKKRS